MKAPSHYFAEFRKEYPSQEITYNSQKWKFIAAGNPDNTPIILLHGGFVDAAMWAYQIKELASDFRIIAPHFPFPPESLRFHCDLINHIMQLECIESATICGISYGGFIAQYFAKYHPQRISRLMVSHNTLPDRAFVKRMKMKSWILRIIPNSFFEKKFKERLSAFGHSDRSGYHQFYFNSIFGQCSKGDFIQGFTSMARNIAEDPLDTSTWDGETVIFSSHDDTDVRKYLDDLLYAYPQAIWHDFPKGGHHAPMTCPVEYTDALRKYSHSGHSIVNV